MVSLSLRMPVGLSALIIVTKTDFWLSDRYTIFKDHVTLGDCILLKNWLQLLLCHSSSSLKVVEVKQLCWSNGLEINVCATQVVVLDICPCRWNPWWDEPGALLPIDVQKHLNSITQLSHTHHVHTANDKKNMILKYYHCEERIFSLSIVT